MGYICKLTRGQREKYHGNRELLTAGKNNKRTRKKEKQESRSERSEQKANKDLLGEKSKNTKVICQ